MNELMATTKLIIMMVPSSSSAFVPACFFFAVILIQCLSVSSTTITRSPPAMFTFGGTQTDVGTNKELNSTAEGNTPFNGIDSNPPKPTGRLSNRWVLADYIAKELGFDQSPPAFLSVNSSNRFDRVITSRGVSFGSATSRILNATGQGPAEVYVPTGQQINQFGTVVRPRLITLLGRPAARSFLAQSFFLFATGSVDIQVQRTTAPPSSDARFLQSFTDQYVDYIRSLYALGGRRFGIVAPGLLGCSPFYYNLNGTDCDARANSLSRRVYRRLASALGQLRRRRSYTDFQYSICNSPNFYFDVIANAPGFPACGLTEVRVACCGNGRTSCVPTSTLCGNRDEYFFWNQYLLTSEGNRLHAAACFGENPRYWTPISFAALPKVKLN